MALSKEQLKKSKGRLKQATVPVPEWADGEETVVIVRALKASETAEIVELVKQGYAESVVVLHFCMIDEEGKRLFSTLDEVQELFEESSFAPFQRCVQKAYELSGLGEAQRMAIEKKSEEMKTSSSG